MQSSNGRPTVPGTVRAALFRLTVFLAVALPATVSIPLEPPPAYPGPADSAARFADFAKLGKKPGTEPASNDSIHLADWIADSGNNVGLPFIIIDKTHARLYLFDAEARLQESTPVLLGAAQGDDSVPGIGLRPIAEVRPEERTTPAGRFIGERGRNLSGEDVVWVDYDAAVSMHRVRATKPAERRLERLASSTAEDNRISYGCINVPIAFYEARIQPMFAARRSAVIYVLPDSRTTQEVFGSYDVAAVYGQAQSRPAQIATASGH